MNTITQHPTPIGPMPRTVRLDESIGLVSIVVALGVLAWIRKANWKEVKP
jgi:hypothetical protein